MTAKVQDGVLSVAELIAALQQVEDKTLPVFSDDYEYGYIGVFAIQVRTDTVSGSATDPYERHEVAGVFLS